MVSTQTISKTFKVGIVGFGAIGTEIARKLDAGVPGLSLVAVCGHNPAAAQSTIETFGHPISLVSIEELVDCSDIIVECATASAFRIIAEPVLRAGKTLLAVSVGGLNANPDLIDLASQFGAKIIVPSGALIGLDGVIAAAEGVIESVRIITRKPPQGLLGAPHLEANNIDLSAISEPTCVFEGTASQAIKGFPANVNVAVALGLAGIGTDKTMVEIWADPTISRNTHQIHLVSDSVTFDATIEGVPSEHNPRTGKLAALSAVSCLRKIAATLQIGS